MNEQWVTQNQYHEMQLKLQPQLQQLPQVQQQQADEKSARKISTQKAEQKSLRAQIIATYNQEEQTAKTSWIEEQWRQQVNQ